MARSPSPAPTAEGSEQQVVAVDALLAAEGGHDASLESTADASLRVALLEEATGEGAARTVLATWEILLEDLMASEHLGRPVTLNSPAAGRVSVLLSMGFIPLPDHAVRAPPRIVEALSSAQRAGGGSSPLVGGGLPGCRRGADGASPVGGRISVHRSG